MNGFNDWLNKVKEDNPKLQTSIEKLEKFITPEGFNNSEFEAIVNKSLKQIEITVPKKLQEPIDVNN